MCLPPGSRLNFRRSSHSTADILLNDITTRGRIHPPAHCLRVAGQMREDVSSCPSWKQRGLPHRRFSRILHERGQFLMRRAASLDVTGRPLHRRRFIA